MASTPPQKSIPTNQTLESITKLKSSIPKLTTEKAKAFEIFKNGYPSGAWIDGQKALLKKKYGEAKSLGEVAQANRNEISMEIIHLTLEHLKELIANSEGDEREKSEWRDQISKKVAE